MENCATNSLHGRTIEDECVWSFMASSECKVVEETLGIAVTGSRPSAGSFKEPLELKFQSKLECARPMGGDGMEEAVARVAG